MTGKLISLVHHCITSVYHNAWQTTGAQSIFVKWINKCMRELIIIPKWLFEFSFGKDKRTKYKINDKFILFITHELFFQNKIMEIKWSATIWSKSSATCIHVTSML